jgi:hypothetical protein
MMQSTFILSLLAASAVSAQQYGSNPETIVESLPRSTPCSTSVDATALPSMIYSVEYSVSIPVELQTSIGIDQPAPSASVYVPVSLHFDAENALAFTSSVAFATPTYGPPPSSTPCSTTAIPTALPALSYSTFFSTTIPIELSISIGIDQPAPSASVDMPASELFNSKNAPAFTSSTAFATPTYGVVSSSTPCSKAIPTPVPEQSTKSTKSETKPTITVFPNQPSVPKPKTTSCTKTKSKATITVFPNQPFVPKPTTASSASTLTDGKSKPTITVFPNQPYAPKPTTPSASTRTESKSKPTITVFPNQPFVPKPATTLSTQTKSKATITVWPKPTAGIYGAPQPPQSRPSKAPSAGQPYQGAPGYGGGRPRYSAWAAAHRPHASAGAAKVSSQPCTLETKTRPSATAAAGGY